MAFAFRQDESIPKGVRRVVRKQLENAAAELDESARESVDERIHSVRKSFKRVRAVVRLVRFSISDSAYRHENESFRDAARPLSEVRDAKVLIESLDKLEKLSRREDKAALFRPARKTLEKRQREVRQRILAEKRTFSDTASAIEKASKRLRQWSDFSGDWKEIAKGIKQVYRSGRKALDEVKANPSVENLHEWRKQAKYLRHQLELLAHSWPKVVGKLAAQAEEIGEILGEDHDLAVLYSILSDDSKQSSDDLSELIKHRRETLQAEAIPKGELLYRERPGEFAARLTDYWNGAEKWPKRQRKAKKRASVTV
jgi:CHAD domain-containing protein